MKTSTLTRNALIAAVALAVALPASSAWGDIVPRGDGSKAVPFRAPPATRDQAVLRHAGSRAVPFVAVERPQPAQPDGFDWADAGLGAGAALALALAGVGGLRAYRRSDTRRAHSIGRGKGSGRQFQPRGGHLG